MVHDAPPLCLCHNKENTHTFIIHRISLAHIHILHSDPPPPQTLIPHPPRPPPHPRVSPPRPPSLPGARDAPPHTHGHRLQRPHSTVPHLVEERRTCEHQPAEGPHVRRPAYRAPPVHVQEEAFEQDPKRLQQEETCAAPAVRGERVRAGVVEQCGHGEWREEPERKSGGRARRELQHPTYVAGGRGEGLRGGRGLLAV